MAWKTATVADGPTAYEAIVADLQDSGFMGVGNAWTKLWEHDLRSATPFSALSRRKTTVFSAPGKLAETILLDFSVLDVAAQGIANTCLYRTGSVVTYDAAGLASGTWKAVWSSAGVAYVAGDIVTTGASSQNSGYVCIVPHASTSSNGPTSGSGFWRALNVQHGGGVFTRGTEPTAYLKSWNGSGGDLTYWLFANKQRAIIVFRSGTTDRRYHLAYMGCLERAGEIDFNPYPVICSGSGGNTAYTDSDDGMFPTLYENSSWSLTSRYLFDLTAQTNTSGFNTWFTPHYPAYDGTPVLKPIFVTLSGSDQTGKGLLGHADSMYAFQPIPGIQSEDELTVGADTYVVFNDVYRGASSFFVAIKKE